MILLLVFAFFFHFAAIYFSYSAGFNAPISTSVLVYSSMDLILSFFVLSIVLIRFRRVVNDFAVNDIEVWSLVFKKSYIILIFFVIWAGFLAYQSYALILQGAARHQLIGEFDTAGYDYMFLSGFFKLAFPFALIFMKDFKVKLILFFGLVICLIITASRSELRYVLNFLLIYLVFFKGNKLLGKVFLFSIVSVFFVVIATLVTVFIQNRPISDGAHAIADMFKNVIQYQAYGYYLAEIALQAGSAVDKALFPFLGYVSEFFSKHLGGSSVPISSEFVGNLHVLGTSDVTGRPFLANVVYPWWSWFVSYFGIAGLLIKSIFVFCFLSLLLNFKMIFSFTLLTSFVVLGTAAAHPFLTLTHTVSFAVALLLDFYFIAYSRHITRSAR